MEAKKLGFGFMRLPLNDQNNPTDIDIHQVNDMVDTFMEKGFTYFDTAFMYHGGHSEAVIQETLVKRHKRETFTLASKLPVMSIKTKEEQEKIFNGQLKKCGVSYFDYYLLHALNADYYETTKRLDSFAFVQQKKKEGKIRNVGFSFHDNAELLEEILTAHPEVDFVQLQINYLDWDDENIQSGKCYEVARRHNKPIIVMEPVKGGTLASVPEKAERIMKDYHPSMSVPSWAIRYAASLEGIMMVLSGMSNREQLLDNTSYMQNFIPLEKEELDIIKEVVSRIFESTLIPCTSCQYCVEGCPKNIAIPKYFSLFNDEKKALELDSSKHKLNYNEYSKTYGKASDCIDCKQCEKHCPQHIEITKYLKDVAKVFEAS